MGWPAGVFQAFSTEANEERGLYLQLKAFFCPRCRLFLKEKNQN
jgi:hypothetical protein|tara:strand:+ start:115 stop:246 length:132 start_codon:yes stop_codon:yes gene_type:complete